MQRIDNLIVHGPAELRVGMQDEGDGAVARVIVVIAGLDAARRPIDDQLGHRFFQLFWGLWLGP
jgi:hypothetical protein